MADHLTPEFTDRGFKHLPPVPSQYGGAVCVYESSLADGPHVWLRVECPVSLNEPDGPMREAAWHGTTYAALLLADQLRWLVEHHYQTEER